ncbi:glycosyltransferase [Desulfobacter postgatei]|uniref:glycosyltransferase n=1 Tax=Desulfobacter postgatei TaxID=2293 RepID=UPI00259B21C9|nr:glycosyltransferase [uncultured Desulfobacter sp.]
MQKKSVFITVAICTFNRSRLLGQTLEQMIQLNVPNDLNWELLVINNNSTDDTNAVIDKYNDSLPIRRIFEKNQGLSYARNRAISEAKGELIVWTDDDVLVNENWLSEYCKGMKCHPNTAFFGGPIRPFFEGPPPRWLKNNFARFEGAFACRDLSNEEIQLNSRSTFPFGANMAVRKTAYDDILYNIKLGRIGTGMLSDEETEIFEELVKRRGQKGVWLPRAQVEHFIPFNRMTIQYLKNYFRGYGQTLVRANDKASEMVPKIFGVPRWTIRYWAMLYMKWILTVIIRHPKKTENWISLQIQTGKMLEYRTLAKVQ